MQARPTGGAGAPPYGEALVDQLAALGASTSLARIGRRHGDYPLPGTCCLANEDGQERAPPGVCNGLGQMVVPEHIGRLQVFVVDRVVLAHEGAYHLVMNVA